MDIQKIQNTKETPSFGTWLGTNIQKKVLLAKQWNAFSKEQLANLEKIENNGIDAFLDISKNFVIKSVKNRKGVTETKKILCLTDHKNKVEITDISNAYKPFGTSNKLAFRLNEFIKIFNDDFNLAQKIEQAWKKLSNIES